MLGDFQSVMEQREEKQASRLSCFFVGLIIIPWKFKALAEKWVKNISLGRKLLNIWEDESEFFFWFRC